MGEHQLDFSDDEQTTAKKRTRKELFLAEVMGDLRHCLDLCFNGVLRCCVVFPVSGLGGWQG
jgi:hypothetical protein